ncbi:MAG: 5'-nucleotidase C-terminal domain-containing protein [Smithellaceae bacterium]
MQRHKNRFLWQKIIKYPLVFLLLIAVACSGGSSDAPPYNYTLTLVHMNDTHSHLEAVPLNFWIDNVKTTAQAGGFPRLKTAIDEMRERHPHLLLLHGGDAVQGTLYFTLFNGEVEFDFLNLLGIDAMTFGNHEFDRGCGPIPGWITRSEFPWLSANIDFTGEPAIAPLVSPYLIKVIQGERVAIIGLTTETTPETTLDVGNAVFHDAVESARTQVQALTAMGINKIILLSHLGYDKDLALAAALSGVDIVVGGHSHSLLGEEESLADIGLASAGPYPTELRAPDGNRVLVLQAWRWGHVLGEMRVRFTPAGEIVSYTSRITVPVGDAFIQNGEAVPFDTQAYLDILAALAASGSARIYPENPQVAALLAPYAAEVAAFRSVKVATAVDPIVQGVNSGPGPLACDSMIPAVPNARAALINYGGVRRDLEQGDIMVGDVLEVMPFGNTLVLVDLTGAELKTALEQGIDFLITHYGSDPVYMPYVASLRFTVDMQAASGSRVSNLAIEDDGSYLPVSDAAVYRIVTNAFVAGGGDGFTAIKNAAGFRSDTGVIDSDAFRTHLATLANVVNPTEERITVVE